MEALFTDPRYWRASRQSNAKHAFHPFYSDLDDFNGFINHHHIFEANRKWKEGGKVVNKTLREIVFFCIQSMISTRYLWEWHIEAV